MINKIKIINYKSIANMDLYFESGVNNIIGKNGIGKTNILLSILSLFLASKINIDESISIGQENLYLEGEYININGFNKVTFSYDNETKKKVITLNGKKVSKKILDENLLKISFFGPITMNLFYLGPKYRRDFLDDIILICFSEYKKLISEYDKILKNRNKVLKNINEGKSKIEEIIFRDEKFILYSQQIYKYRIDLINYIRLNINNYKDVFLGKIQNIEFNYKTKVDLNNIKNYIGEYLKTNLNRDIIIGKTHIGPHVDDFEILIDNRDLLSFVSRGEMKSIIISLKLLEIDYIKGTINKNPILLIDDLSSELDEEHKELIIKKMSDSQIITTSISALLKDNVNIINL